ncbi:HWE histidine kinase domain-containing protein [Roseibium sp. M-1]
MRRLTWHNSSQSDQELREYLIVALLRSRACVTLQDDTLSYLFIANLPRIWSVPPGVLPSDEIVFGARIGAKLVAAKNQVLKTGEAGWVEVKAGEGSLFEVHIEIVPSLEGRQQVLTTVVDVTETRRRERVLRDLLLEVSHRSKNLLAIIQGLASQSARYAETLEQFLSEFRGRIYALSSSQDLVTEADWFGVSLRELADAQAVLQEESRRPEFVHSGINPVLTPNAALYLGLGLHELMAWLPGRARDSRRQKVLLSCQSLDGDAPGSIEIEWHMVDDGNGEEPSDRDQRPSNFSSLLLEQVIPQSLNGSATFGAVGRSPDYRLKFPQSSANIRQGAAQEQEREAKSQASPG